MGIQLIEVNGAQFRIESHGWSRAEQDRDNAVDRLEAALRRKSAAALAKISQDTLDSIAFLAVKFVTKRWHDPCAPSICITRVDD